MSRIAYVTSELGLEVDQEVGLVCGALSWEPVRWDDQQVEWSTYDLAVCRSPWDYTWRRSEFVEWVRRADGATRLLNPAAVLIRNTDKTYLRELSAPVVPTVWGVPEDLPWDEVVVKPSVSAGARDTIRTSTLEEARAHARSIVASGKTPMTQPYLRVTEAEGEMSVVWLGGEPSHAVRKPPMLVPEAGEDPRYDIRPIELSGELVDFSARVLEEIPEELLYARVDVIRAADGSLQLMELELTEPYLFLTTSPGSVERLAAAVDRMTS